MSPDAQVGVAAIMLISLLGLGLVFICKPLWAKLQASELLHDVLTPEQNDQLVQKGHIDIPSPNHPDRVYRVPGTPGYVQVREKGKLTMKLCLQPSISVPYADIVLIHKLMIEADEETYLQKANCFFP
jgi:hypothetical protein